MGKAIIYPGFISAELEELLQTICEKKDKDEVHIAPFNRFGNSGSNLYLIFFSKDKSSVPHLLKTNSDKVKAENEVKAMKILEEKYSYTECEPFFTDKLHGILLEYHFDDKHNEFKKTPKTIKNIIFEDKGNEICKHIEKALEGFRNVYKPSDQENCFIKDCYKKYLRGNETKEIIKELTKDNIDSEKIDFFGQEITNPVYIMENMIEKTTITKSLIHGDLHTDNIVINHENCPRIVDFAWSTENDIYIDFALLEVSARYWGTPFFLNSASKKELEDRTLKEPIDIENIGNFDIRVQRMMSLANQIRQCCKDIVGKNFKFERYLLSQFIILYGLQKFTDNYNPFIVIPFLGRLGDQLKEYKYVKERSP